MKVCYFQQNKLYQIDLKKKKSCIRLYNLREIDKMVNKHEIFHSSCFSLSQTYGLFCLLTFTGIMYEAKGHYKEALKAFGDALDVDPGHVPSLISTAVVLKRCSNKSNPAVKSFLVDALRHDRFNASAWYNLGLLHKAEGTASSLVEAAECFQAAHFLEESAPVEPFR